jgi:3-oxoacyl-[acyl-carrier-protein] synthase-3
MLRPLVLATGSCLPAQILTNRELESRIDTTHEWIVERTGIEQRHIAAEGQLTSHLAAEAAKQALERAGVAASTVDTIIVATATPDTTMPATATRVQQQLGIPGAAAFDVNAACSGFVYALSLARALVASGQSKRLLVIGAEIFSRLLDWNDRTTCILFGDGAAALLLDAQPQAGTAHDRGLLTTIIHADGTYGDMLATSGGVALNQQAGVLSMAGKEVYRHAVAKMPEATQEAMQQLGLPLSAIDWLVPHQANLRIMASVGEKLGIDSSKVVSTVQRHANTSAASIPLALDVAAQDGRLRAGQLIACPAMGAGFTWGCALLRW